MSEKPSVLDPDAVFANYERPEPPFDNYSKAKLDWRLERQALIK